MNTFMPSSDSSDFDDDDIMNKERERRFAELKQHQKANQNATTHYHGQLQELSNEQDLLHAALHSPRLVVLFHLPSFKRCQKMSELLFAMAKQFPQVRFVQVEATRAPFLTDKWAIKQLPCVVRIEEREAVDKVVGFEGVMREGSEEVDYELLVGRLVR